MKARTRNWLHWNLVLEILQYQTLANKCKKQVFLNLPFSDLSFFQEQWHNGFQTCNLRGNYIQKNSSFLKQFQALDGTQVFNQNSRSLSPAISVTMTLTHKDRHCIPKSIQVENFHHFAGFQKCWQIHQNCQ